MAAVFNRNLVFVHGKGGVGKTVVSQAIALALSQKNQRTLWITIEDPTRPEGERTQINPHLWHFNCSFQAAFEEYVGMKIGIARLAKLFLQNKLMQYLSKAAPGVHELVLLGKIWYERNHYDHVIVDMPSTGYGLAMFQSTENFAALFGGGPLHKDSEAMIQTLGSPEETGHLIVSIPEEMPLRESMELNEFLIKRFQKNPAQFLVNRLFPSVLDNPLEPPPNLKRGSPLATSVEDYAIMRSWLEAHNLRLWNEAGIEYGYLNQIPPQDSPLVLNLVEQIRSRGYLS